MSDGADSIAEEIAAVEALFAKSESAISSATAALSATVTKQAGRVHLFLQASRVKQIALILTFMEGYPNTLLHVELSSKTLQDSEVAMLQKLVLSSRDSAKSRGEKQAVAAASTAKTILTNRLLPCAGEVKRFREFVAKDTLLMNESKGSVQIKFAEGSYRVRMKFVVPDKVSVNRFV